MEETKRKETIKASIAIAIIVITIAIAIILNIRYSVEGETNMPFNLAKITIVSTAEGVENQAGEEKWNLQLYQNNDIYFSIEKNENNTKEDKIQTITIENIQITKTPQKGTIKAYMPNSSEGRTFAYTEDTIIQEGKLQYKGATKSNTQTLEIGNQGGTAILRFSNTDIGSYISNEDAEIKHDGSLLTKTNATIEDLKFAVNFDFCIKTKNNQYKSNISLDLPCGDIITEGKSSKEITKENFIFKRM